MPADRRRQPFPGNIIPQNRITADGRAIAKVYERDDRTGGRSTPTRRSPTTRPSSSISRSSPGRTSSASTTGRTRRKRVLRALPARQVQPDRAARHVHRRAMPTIPTNRVRPGYGIQVGAHLDRPAEPVQRRQGHRVVERPADSAGRRQLEARHLRLRVPAGLRPRPLRRRRHSRCHVHRHRRRRQIVGPSESLLSPTTDITFTDKLTWIKERAHGPRRA